MHSTYGKLAGRLPALMAAPRIATGARSSKLSPSWKLRPLLSLTQQRANSTDPTVDFPALDRKWRRRWAGMPTPPARKSKDASGEKPMYILPMFPYPSGTLHMGHLRVYTIGDVLARYYKLAGKEVITAMGWDSFGLPAENAAIERGSNPATWTRENIAKMKTQLELMNGSWDWSRELSTCDPEFYKHTQRIFTLLHEMGLAYQAEAEVNFDPVDNTVLANEQVSADGYSWRSGAKVEKRKLKQWFLKISEFREELLKGLDVLAKDEKWPEHVLTQQRNWLGKSMGTSVNFPIMFHQHEIKGAKAIEVFTTRLDTLFGVQYLALAPTHPMVLQLATKDPELQAFLDTAHGFPPESKVGYLLPHVRAINPLAYHEETPDEAKKSMPVYVASYVLGDYGEGAVMGVPGHDHRDHAFWKLHHDEEPVRVVLAASEDESTTAMLNEPFTGHGVMTEDSGPYKGKTSEEAGKMLLAMLEKANLAKPVEKWRLRDWLISRQRYWGAPIPIIHCTRCGAVPVPNEHLPVTLPDASYHFEQKLRGNPLQGNYEWQDVSCPKCGGHAKRDTDTMDTFVDSSWYFMRFTDPNNKDVPFDAEKVKALLPVDLYIGGSEHAILHLLYARFIYKALMRSSLINKEGKEVTEVQEPFTRLVSQGMVLGKTWSDPATGKFLCELEVDDRCPGTPKVAVTGEKVKVTYEKMSKSKYNGVDPTKVLTTHGADATRAHILFQAPVHNELYWDEVKISGINRWLQRVHKMVAKVASYPALPEGETPRSFLEKQLASLDRKAPAQMARWDSNCAVWSKVQEAIAVVTTSYERVSSLNTVVSDLMTLTNGIARNPLATDVEPVIERAAVESLIRMLAPIAPSTAEEAWAALHPNDKEVGIFHQLGEPVFPVQDGSLEFMKPRNQTCSVQVNGKLKTVAVVPLPPPGLDEEALRIWLTAEILRTVEGDGKMDLGTTIREAKRAIVVKGGKTINFVSAK